MDSNMIGMLAFSKAGHDKDSVFMIIKEDKEYVYLCDGKLRPLEQPKKKRKKHVQPIKQGYDRLAVTKLLQKQVLYNEEIKKVITDFIRRKEEVNV